MLSRRIPVLLLLVMVLPTLGQAQSLFDKIKKGATNAVESVGEAVDSTADLVVDEGTPETSRAKINAMAEKALVRLFAEQPAAKPLFERSAGYAVFDVRKLTLKVAGGFGRGVAVNRVDGARIYMNMAVAGVGRSFGFGGFESQLILLFETPDRFRSFVENGLDATAEGGTMFGDDKSEVAARFTDGKAVYVLTKKGWRVAASATGTKYWRDGDLN